MSAPLLLARIRVALGAVCLAKAAGLAWIGAGWPWVVLWGLASLALAAGIRARLAAAVLSVLAVGVFLIGFGSNHLVLMAMLFLLFAAADSDRHLALWPGSPGSLGSDLPLFLLRCQVSIVYGSAGLVKINDSWIGGDALAFYLGRAMMPLPDEILPLLPVLALGVIALELLLAAFPWFSRTRRPAVAVAVLLHLGMLPVAIHWLDALQIAIFGALMLVMLSAFFQQGRLWWLADPRYSSAQPHPCASTCPDHPSSRCDPLTRTPDRKPRRDAST